MDSGQDAEEFIPASGTNYRTFFSRVHELFVFDFYIEIGCRSCETLALSQSKSIGVDPFFRPEINFIQNKPSVYIMQMTSDDFFESGFLERNDIRVNLSFIDGMHLIEYVLNDFVNLERQSAPNGVILIHDCIPYSYPMTTRDLKNLPPKAWTGDVWKIIPILREYRPDLRVDVLDCSPTGLVVVSGLDPSNDVFEKNRHDVLAQYLDMELADFGLNKFYKCATVQSADSYLTETDTIRFAAGDKSLIVSPKKVSP